MTRDTPNPKPRPDTEPELQPEPTFDPFHLAAPRRRSAGTKPKAGRPAHLPNPRLTPSSQPRPRPTRRGGMR